MPRRSRRRHRPCVRRLRPHPRYSLAGRSACVLRRGALRLLHGTHAGRHWPSPGPPCVHQGISLKSAPNRGAMPLVRAPTTRASPHVRAPRAPPFFPSPAARAAPSSAKGAAAGAVPAAATSTAAMAFSLFFFSRSEFWCPASREVAVISACVCGARKSRGRSAGGVTRFRRQRSRSTAGDVRLIRSAVFCWIERCFPRRERPTGSLAGAEGGPLFAADRRLTVANVGVARGLPPDALSVLWPTRHAGPDNAVLSSAPQTVLARPHPAIASARHSDANPIVGPAERHWDLYHRVTTARGWAWRTRANADTWWDEAITWQETATMADVRLLFREAVAQSRT